MLGSSCVLVLCGVLVVAADVRISDTNPTIIRKTFESPDGIYGVASISGVASRNGRVSSMSGVRFYPTSNQQSTAFAKSGDKLPEPITFSKEENGKYTSGTIKIGPGSVSVSSIARSGFPGDSSKLKQDNDMFFASIPTFHARSLDPWFTYNNHNNMQPFRFRSFNTLRPNWAYPNYNPYFNLWR